MRLKCRRVWLVGFEILFFGGFLCHKIMEVTKRRMLSRLFP